MNRILVDPEALQSLASQLDEVAAGLQELGRRSGQSLAQADWAASSLHRPEGQMEAASRLGASLGHEAFELSRSLRQTAERFRAANAWRPSWSGGGAPGASPVFAAASVGGAFAAGAAATGFTVGRESTTPSSDPMAALYAQFPDPQLQAILTHVVKAEGMHGPNDAHGGVVYWDENGIRKSDRQWLNFGYISFAMPKGTGGDVLRRIFDTPGEEEAFRAIALRHLEDQPAGQVPDSHSRLLYRTGTEIPALSASAQVDQFIAEVKAGRYQPEEVRDEALADWFFKYGNTPEVDDKIANGHLRPEWKAVMDEFLGRPASVQAQVQQIDQSYLTPAIKSAERFGLHSTLGVAWFTDQHVQSGSPNLDMKAMLKPAPPPDSPLYEQWQRYQSGTEAERLQVLTELSGPLGSTVRKRREDVLANHSIPREPFTGLA